MLQFREGSTQLEFLINLADLTIWTNMPKIGKCKKRNLELKPRQQNHQIN